MRRILFLLMVLLFSKAANAQVANDTLTLSQDSTLLRTNPAFQKDSVTIAPGVKVEAQAFSPKKATIRSAILPGWGQAYTKRYLMIPVVYAALGVPAGFYIYNNTWYKRTRFAYEIKVDNDSSRFGEIHRDLSELSPESLRFYRNDFRRNRDYSVLFFILAWGLNVVDATVFAHLKEFDVSDDLSLKVKPNIDFNRPGFSLVLSPKNTSTKRMLMAR
ncbi:DUF5683 domain-containing protein [Aridibaculum aurantiacum]|uniref:DUF5683 domain-containing protein n=1 Tax=Aridibaculum aurantiacum TaxID=2810307 RepID=UPI001A960C58|nr:DUF5683 domain-containing protein [Aridibaculum aurantiacum]